MVIPNRIKSLRDAINEGKEAWYKQLNDWLRDPLAYFEKENIYAYYVELSSKPCITQTEAKEISSIGVFLIIQEVENRTGIYSEESDKSEGQYDVNKLLKDKGVNELINDLWEIKKEDAFKDTSLRAIGTTSFILKQSQKKLAIKLVKPRYWGIQLIEQSNLEYRNLIEVHRENTPKIHACGEKYIIMDFIEEFTLREYISKNDPDLNKIKNIIIGLCKVLKNFPSPHGDLSTENIIIQEKTEHDSLNLYLIDFGFNYILSVSVGTTEKYRSTQAYIAPEFEDLKKASKPTFIGDAYSLGVILAELILGNEFKEQDIPSSLDKVHENCEGTGLGSLLTDMLYPDYNHRLIGVIDRNNKEKIYEYIIDRITEEVKIANRIEKYEQRKWINEVVNFLGTIVFPGTREFLLVFIRKQRIIFDDFLTSMTLALHITLLVKSGRILWNQVIGTHEDIIYSLPVLLVAITSSYAATKYYIEIFSDIRTNEMPWWLRFPIRLNAIFFAIPVFFILSTYTYWPEARIYWGIAYGIGTVSIGTCAYSCHTFCKKAIKAENGKKDDKILKLLVRPSMNRMLADIESWWQMNFVVFLAVLLGQVLLLTHLGKDEFFYAFLIILANIFMYFFSIPREKMVLRTGLRGFVEVYRRRDKPAEKVFRDDPTETVSPNDNNETH